MSWSIVFLAPDLLTPPEHLENNGSEDIGFEGPRIQFIFHITMKLKQHVLTAVNKFNKLINWYIEYY